MTKHKFCLLQEPMDFGAEILKVSKDELMPSCCHYWAVSHKEADVEQGESGL